VLLYSIFFLCNILVDRGGDNGDGGVDGNITYLYNISFAGDNA
jgi:hypothetical protein